jgi:hypothetical protein
MAEADSSHRKRGAPRTSRNTTTADASADHVSELMMAAGVSDLTHAEDVGWSPIASANLLALWVRPV